MKSFGTLLKMQLLMRFGGLRPSRLKDSLDQNKGRKLAMLAAWIILGCSLVGTIAAIGKMLFNGFLALEMPEMLLTLAVTMGMLSTLMLGFFLLTSTLFLSKDSSYLAALPIKSGTLLLARLAAVWMSETLIMAVFYVPVLVIYGTGMGMGAGFYLIGFVVLLFCPVLPMMIATLLSALLIRVSALWKNRERMTTIGSIIFLLLIVFMQTSLTRVLPDDASTEYVAGLLSANNALFQSVTRLFPPAAWATGALIGQYAQLAYFVLACVGALAVVYLILAKPYQSLSLLQTEATVSRKKIKLERAAFSGTSPLRALYRIEWREILRSPVYMINAMGTVIIPIILVFVAGMGAMGSEGMFSIDALKEMDGSMIAMILAALYCYSISVNPCACTGISRDAKRHGLMRALPVAPYTRVKAKLLMSLTIGAVAPLPITIVLSVAVPSLGAPALAATVLALAFNLPMCAFSLWIDMLRPKMTWSSENEAMKQNTNVIFSMLIGLTIIGLCALGCYLLINAGINIYMTFGVLTAALLALGYGSVSLLRNSAERLLGGLEA